MQNKEIIKRILSYLSKYKLLIALLIIFSLFFSLISLYIPILVGDAIDLIAEEGKVDFEGILPILIKTALLAVVAGFSEWLVRITGNKITFGTVMNIRQEAFEKLLKLPLSYIDSHKHGDVVSRIITDAGQFADGLIMSFTQLFTGVVTILGTIFFMMRINVKISLIVILLTPLSLFVASFIAKNTYNLFKKQTETRGALTGLIDEFLGGQKVVRAFAYERRAEERFGAVNDTLEKHTLKALFFSSITNPATRFVNNIVYAFVGGFGAFSVVGGAMTVGGLSAFLSYAGQYTKPFNEISGVVTELQNSIACAGRIFEFISEPSEVDDASEKIESPEGRVTFENVSFSYSEDKPLIEKFSLDVSAGERVAIVGPTGCGKTTLINLIMRFYDVNSGRITIDGVDIKSVTRNNLRSGFGMVLQDTFIKKGTVAENIALGKKDATIDEIVEAAKKCHAHSFITRLSKGYDTVITGSGSGLSEGQKQLICIARVMLLMPPMLILDEATSSIDTRTEVKIQDAFMQLMKNKTSFVVAHRLSTIKNSDVILVMKDGKVVETGKHHELISKGGFYKELYYSGKEESYEG